MEIDWKRVENELRRGVRPCVWSWTNEEYCFVCHAPKRGACAKKLNELIPRDWAMSYLHLREALRG